MSMNIIEKSIDYKTVLNYVNVVATNSFGKSGKYHKYLQNYAETLCLLTMYTDYKVKATNEDDLLSEILEIYHSDEWQDKIIPELGGKYTWFHYYVEEEVMELNKPLAKLDSMILSVKELADKANALVGSIDPEALKNLNVDELTQALDEYNKMVSDKEEKEEQSNIVELKK